MIAGPFCNATGPTIGKPIYVSKGNDVTVNFKTSAVQGIAVVYSAYSDYLENYGEAEGKKYGNYTSTISK